MSLKSSRELYKTAIVHFVSYLNLKLARHGTRTTLNQNIRVNCYSFGQKENIEGKHIFALAMS